MMFINQVNDFLQTLNADNTRCRYEAALREFEQWYRITYGSPPDANHLTTIEAREWRGYLVTVKKLGAASVNLRLAALRGLARYHRQPLEVKGVKRVEPPVEPLNSREIGRLLSAVDGETWLSKRNVAILSLLVRAGLRVSEAVALSDEDITLSERKGQVVVRHGKGLKERHIPLGRQVRADLQSYTVNGRKRTFCSRDKEIRRLGD